MRSNKMLIKLFWSLVYTVLWELWKARNDQAFKNKKVNPMKVAEEIQVKAFNWIKNRANFGYRQSPPPELFIVDTKFELFFI
ncbi:hypothetical protein LXL04_023117 [Taraxacum kok-saghyz]